MSDISPTTNIKLPVALLVGGIATILSIGAAMGVAKFQVESVQKDVETLEKRFTEASAKQDVRIQRGEETTSRIMEVLGRIDERTSTLVRQSEKNK